MNKTKVCIFCETWESGGIESFLMQIFRHVDQNRIQICLSVADKRPGVYDAELAERNVELCEFNRRGGALSRTIGSLRPFYTLCKHGQFDVVHLNIFHGIALLLGAAARMAGVKRVIVHSHGAGLRASRTYHIKMLAHRACAFFLSDVATERWAPSKAAAEFLFPKGKPVQIIENGIDVERFRFDERVRQEVREELNVGSRLVIGCVGRLENQKNQMFLLDVLAELLPQRDAVLLLVGDGEDRKGLQEKAERLGLRDHVIFYGYSDAVQRLMWAMDVLAVPSVNEGLSIAAIEAQAAGLLVICSNGVPKEARITDAVTYLSTDSVKQWAAYLETCRVPQDRLLRNSEVANSKFEISVSVKKILEAYEKP